MKYMLGLDIGTTGAKSLLVDPNGRVVSSASAGYATDTPKPLWSEQDPEDWWQATQLVFRKVLNQSNVAPPEILAIGLTGQMHGLVSLDSQGRVLRPCILWNDQRTFKQCADITAKVGSARLTQITANPVLTGFTAPKIVWVRENEPGIYERIAHILLPKDYVRYRLTGEVATEFSDASGTSLLNVRERSWADEILELLEIPKSWMPRLFKSVEVTGSVTRHVADQLGLRPGTPVVGGGGDQAAGAVGSGVVRPGILSVVVGTSGVVFAHTDELVLEPGGLLHSFCHAVPDAWHVMGVTLAAGGSFQWLRNVFSHFEARAGGQGASDPYEWLTSGADQVKPGSEGLIFLPYISGIRTPHADSSARGVFFGLTARHHRQHLVRSVMEGVAYSLRDCLELIQSVGLDIEQIRISGGGARSELWRQIMADVFDKELVTLQSTQGAPYGAALLSGVGAGVYTNIREACGQVIKIAARTIPNRENARTYQDHYGVYQGLYPALKNSFTRISEVMNRSLP